MCVKELMYTQKYILTEKYSYHLKVIFVEFISIYFHKTNQYCGYIIHVFFFYCGKFLSPSIELIVTCFVYYSLIFQLYSSEKGPT